MLDTKLWITQHEAMTIIGITRQGLGCAADDRKHKPKIRSKVELGVRLYHRGDCEKYQVKRGARSTGRPRKKKEGNV